MPPQPRLPPRKPSRKDDDNSIDGVDLIDEEETRAGEAGVAERRPPRRGYGRGGRGDPRLDPRFDELDEFGDDDLDYFDDDPQNMYGSEPNYNQAVSKGQYIRVHFIKPLIKHIDGTTLFPDTKETLKIMANGLFDKTEVLARTTNLRLEEIDTEIMLAQARIGFHPSDIDNPDLANIYNLMRKLYRRFISRSINGWERELDNRMETSSTIHHSDTRYQQAQVPAKSSYPIWHPRRWI